MRAAFLGIDSPQRIIVINCVILLKAFLAFNIFRCVELPSVYVVFLDCLGISDGNRPLATLFVFCFHGSFRDLLYLI